VSRRLDQAISMVIILIAVSMVLAIVVGTVALKFGCRGLR
jgi:hypothetical protein